ncbi:hypothetical protein [Solimonas aquatica]|uniref:hypothetical protein n=1 Tax=Solimonas aquatica TaxID=489703 RepID=UPI000B866219|nr:hypothetical protein [Solimonas aquatica]
MDWEALDWLSARRILFFREQNGIQIPSGIEVANLVRDSMTRYPWLFRGVESDAERLGYLCKAHSYNRLPQNTSARSFAMAGHILEAGLSNQHIAADRLDLSLSTVKGHL